MDTYQVHRGMLHIKFVEQVRNFSTVIACNPPASFPKAAALLRDIARAPKPSESKTSPELALVCQLVLQDVEVSVRIWPCTPTPQGQQLLQMVQAAVFPEVAWTSTLMDAVRCGSIEQAAAVCNTCEILLRDAICDSSNCVEMLLVAKEQGWVALQAKCVQIAVDSFQSVASQLPRLPHDVFLEIVSSDHIQVKREMDVWCVVGAWLSYDLDARRSHAATLLTKGVRVMHLSRLELEVVDSHPAVRACMRSSGLVAAAFLHTAGVHGSVCSILSSPELWSHLVEAQPRLCLLPKQQPATPAHRARRAAAATPPTFLYDAQPLPGTAHINPLPIPLRGLWDQPALVRPVDIGAVVHAADNWIIGDHAWEDATSAQIRRSVHAPVQTHPGARRRWYPSVKM